MKEKKSEPKAVEKKIPLPKKNVEEKEIKGPDPELPERKQREFR